MKQLIKMLSGRICGSIYPLTFGFIRSTNVNKDVFCVNTLYFDIINILLT